MIPLVVDASVAVKWLVEEDGSKAADRLVRSDYDLRAPRLMASEVASALSKKARMGELPREKIGILAAAISAMPVRWGDDEHVCADAVRLALTLRHPVYDCVYLALAHHVGGRMVTADARFATALAPTVHGGSVLLLADMFRTDQHSVGDES